MRTAYSVRNILISLLVLVTIISYFNRRDSADNNWKKIATQLKEENNQLNKRLFEMKIPAVENSQTKIVLPNIREFLPHLFNTPLSSVEPIHLSPKPDDSRKKMVLAVPAVERSKQDYLIPTIRSLISKSDSRDRNNTLILVMLTSAKGEHAPFIIQTAARLSQIFKDEVNEGFLQIITVPDIWYPTDLQLISPTFSDSPKRMYWRSKQNLDFLYMMIYGRSLADYYMQLEDDIKAIKGYTKTILDYIKLIEENDWITIEFSTLGCIGKLFRSRDLSLITHSIAMNYKYKPIDWIIADIYKSRYCSPEWSAEKCATELDQYRVRFFPAQFQHMGVYSSLEGKIQSLRDRTFGLSNFSGRRSNPPANLECTIDEFENFTLNNAYTKPVFLWLLSPRKDDYIKISFKQLIRVRGILFSTGTEDHPNDKFGNETIVSIIASGEQEQNTIGRFDDSGRFYKDLNSTVIETVFITVKDSLDHWVIMDQLFINQEL